MLVGLALTQQNVNITKIDTQKTDLSLSFANVTHSTHTGKVTTLEAFGQVIVGINTGKTANGTNTEVLFDVTQKDTLVIGSQVDSKNGVACSDAIACSVVDATNKPC